MAGLSKTFKSFSVSEKPVVVDGIEVPGKKAIVRNDNQRVIGIVGSGFKTVDDLKLMEHFDEILTSAKIPYHIGNHWEIRGGSKTISEIILYNKIIKVAKNDELVLRSYVVNGYDGLTSARMMMGFIRIVCSNLSIFGQSQVSIFSKHVGDVNSTLVDTFQNYIQRNFQNVEGITRHLVKTKITHQHAESIIQQSKWLGEKYLGDVSAELLHTSDRTGTTLWDLYNSYTKVITHGIKANIEQKVKHLIMVNRKILTWAKTAQKGG